MTSRKENWLARRREITARKPWLRIDRVRIRPLWWRKGYAVAIHGIHLHAGSSPYLITVGDVAMARVRFHPEGRVLYGYLSDKPASNLVIVDLGFARDEVQLKILTQAERLTWRLQR